MTPFERAFARACKAGKKTFVFNGQVFNTNLKPKYAPTTVGYNSSLVREYNFSNKNMPELLVNAPRIVIKSGDSKEALRTQFLLLPYTDVPDLLQGRVYLDYITGLIFVTDNHGIIRGSTMSPEAAARGEFPNYQGDSTREAQRLAAISNAEDEIYNATAGNNRGLTTEDLVKSMNNAKRAFVNTVQGVVNVPNHIIVGGLKTAMRDDYTLGNYWEGLADPRIENLLIGAGDLFEVENPYVRTALNFINPETIATINVDTEPMRFSTKQVKPIKFEVTAEGKPVSSMRVSHKSGAVRLQPVRHLVQNGYYGYGQAHHLPVTATHRSGAPYMKLTVVVPLEELTVMPGYFNVSGTPVNFVPLPYNTVSSRLPLRVDQGHVETIPISPWQQQWIDTGEVPEGFSVGKQSTREGVWNTDQTYWRGLEGLGRKYSSALSNTTNNGLGYSTVRPKRKKK